MFKNHFLPFVIFFYKMGAGGHFGCPKLTFDGISGHFRSIRIFFLFVSHNGCRRPFWMSEIHFRPQFLAISDRYATLFFWKFLTKWLPSAILDIRNSHLIAFPAISDRYATLFFGCPKFTFDRISGHFRSIRNFIFF